MNRSGFSYERVKLHEFEIAEGRSWKRFAIYMFLLAVLGAVGYGIYAVIPSSSAPAPVVFSNSTNSTTGA